MNLNKFGWNSDLEKEFEEYRKKGFFPGRIICEHKKSYEVMTELDEKKAIISRSLADSTFYSEKLPVVGDWVVLEQRGQHPELFINHTMKRKSVIARKKISSGGRKFSKPGNADMQPIVANIDTIFIVMALDRDFKLRKLERYLTLIWDSGSTPVIILNKADECFNADDLKEEAEEIAYGVPVHLTSAKFRKGIEELSEYFESGKTIALVGSSGVGKSSLINALLNEERMYVSHNRDADKRGRHTTTHREMILFPNGGIIIDNPGLKELKLAASEEALDNTFRDIAQLAENCKFNDCKHRSEPGCAVKKAIIDGDLSEKRLANYRKLLRELQYFERRKFYKQKYYESGNWQDDKYRARKNKPHQIDYMEKIVDEWNKNH